MAIRSLQVILIGLFFCISCTSEVSDPVRKPKDLISEDTYVDILIELQLAKVVFNSDREKINTDSLLTVIYDKYGVSEDIYLESHSWYQSNYSEQQRRVGMAINRLDSLTKSFEVTSDTSLTDTTLTDSTQSLTN